MYVDTVCATKNGTIRLPKPVPALLRATETQRAGVLSRALTTINHHWESTPILSSSMINVTTIKLLLVLLVTTIDYSSLSTYYCYWLVDNCIIDRWSNFFLGSNESLWSHTWHHRSSRIRWKFPASTCPLAARASRTRTKAEVWPATWSILGSMVDNGYGSFFLGNQAMSGFSIRSRWDPWCAWRSVGRRGLPHEFWLINGKHFHLWKTSQLRVLRCLAQFWW